MDQRTKLSPTLYVIPIQAMFIYTLFPFLRLTFIEISIVLYLQKKNVYNFIS